MSYFKFKVVLLGAAAVGKTSLLYRYINNKFADDYAATIGVDFLSKEVEFEEDKCKITIWDLAGQQKFKFLRKNFYGGTHGALLIFDLTREGSFNEINDWYQEMKEFSKKIPFLLIGNKSDLVEERAIDKAKAHKFAEFFQSLYIETSAKTGENVKQAFMKLMGLMAENKGQHIK